MTLIPRWQSVLFLCVAAAACTAAAAGARLPARTELLAAAWLIGLVGLPHGAIDPLLAARVYRIRRPVDWAVFGLRYVALAAVVVMAWFVAPSLFLLGFLVISVIHFADDLPPQTLRLSRIVYGATVIVLPTVRYASDTAYLLGLVAGAEAAAPVTALLQLLAWPLALAAAGLVVIESRRDRRSALDMAAVALLAALSPPLVSFTVFFCLMHSLRHLLRAAMSVGGTSVPTLARAARWPLLGTGAVAAAGWVLLGGQTLDAAVMQLVFVGLAALTLPHMVLVEAAARAGWPLAADLPALRPARAS
jgi:Brp/Blh family beta-carotene 15,15'-monooxygenase